MQDAAFIPFHIPTLGEAEISEVVATLRSGWLTTGPRTKQFETEFAQYVGASHSLAVNSCTAGLHLALAALGVGQGDEVITTPLTFCATVNTILHVGATPVLADIGEDGNLDPQSVAKRITSRTKAIMPVHFAGLSCDMEAIWALARDHGLYVVEDAAHAVGTTYRERPIGGPAASGNHSDAVVFSFYATKNLTTGEGGMVTTESEELHDRMKVLCLHGISKDAWNRYSEKGNWYYEVTDLGFKYNLSDLQSAIGIHQLRRQEEFIDARQRIAGIYNDRLSESDAFEMPPDSADGRNCWHLYPLRLNLDKLAINRDEFIAELRGRGVGASVHFIPIPLHPAYRDLARRPENYCPRAIALYPRLVSLPLHPSLTEGEVETIVSAALDATLVGRKAAAAA